MKIDHDLRAAINAAAKAQPEYSYTEETKQLQECVDAFLKKRPSLKRGVDTLIKERKALRAKQDTLEMAIHKILGPIGLSVYEMKVQTNFRRNMDDEDAKKFIAAGGQLPPPSRRKWSATTVIARLAAADPRDRDAILKEYGINWT